MFDIKIDFDNINISSIEKDDIKSVYDFFNSQKRLNANFKEHSFRISQHELYQRFLEYYVNECEYFLKINIDGELVGIIKGRVEFKNPNEVWIGVFILNSEYSTVELETRIMDEMINYFNKEYGIKDFYTGVDKEDKIKLNFWKECGYKVVRLASCIYKEADEGQGKDMLILKKSI